MGNNYSSNFTNCANIIIENYNLVKDLILKHGIDENDRDDLLQLITERIICEVDKTYIDQDDLLIDKKELLLLQLRIQIIIDSSFLEYHTSYLNKLNDYYDTKEDNRLR